MASVVSREWMPGAADLRTLRRGTINLGEYATGGVAVDVADFDAAALVDLDVRPSEGYVPEWDAAAGTVLVYEQSGAAGPLVEVADTTDLSAVEFRFAARVQEV